MRTALDIGAPAFGFGPPWWVLWVALAGLAVVLLVAASALVRRPAVWALAVVGVGVVAWSFFHVDRWPPDCTVNILSFADAPPPSQADFDKAARTQCAGPARDQYERHLAMLSVVVLIGGVVVARSLQRRRFGPVPRGFAAES